MNDTKAPAQWVDDTIDAGGVASDEARLPPPPRRRRHFHEDRRRRVREAFEAEGLHGHAEMYPVASIWSTTTARC